MIEHNQYQTYLSPREYNKLVSLVGQKSIVQCYMEDQVKNVLWDRGANVSLIDKSSLSEWFPSAAIKDLSELIGENEEFDVKWGNQSKLPFVGWVELKVSLKEGSSPDNTIPFLVTPEYLDHPILGTNAIEYLTHKLSKAEIFSTFEQALP